MIQQINAADDLSRQHIQMHFCRRFRLKNENELFSRGHLLLFHFLFYLIFLPAFIVSSVLVFNIVDTGISAPKSGGLIWVHTVCLYTYIDQ